jgi:hypothetical protein
MVVRTLFYLFASALSDPYTHSIESLGKAKKKESAAVKKTKDKAKSLLTSNSKEGESEDEELPEWKKEAIHGRKKHALQQSGKSHAEETAAHTTVSGAAPPEDGSADSDGAGRSDGVANEGPSASRDADVAERKAPQIEDETPKESSTEANETEQVDNNATATKDALADGSTAPDG